MARHAFSYDEFDDCLRTVDAVYIALPNSMHAEYTIRAARAGIHVICEKPMAVTLEECRRMIAACRRTRVKLMIAYRLHFETLNLAAMDLARHGRLGVLKFFNSSFSMTVRRGDIRTKRACGGGMLIKGRSDVLIRDGNLEQTVAVRNRLSEHDIAEDLRLHGNIDKIAHVKLAVFERNGHISVVLKRSE